MVFRDERYYDYDNPTIVVEEPMYGAYVQCDEGGLVEGQVWDEYCACHDVYIADDFVFEDGFGGSFIEVVEEVEVSAGGGSNGYGGYSDAGGSFGGGGSCGGGGDGD